MGKLNKKIKAVLLATITIIMLSFMFSFPGVLIGQDETTGETTLDTIDIPEELIFDVTYPKLNAKAGLNFEFSVDLTYQGDEEATIDLTTEGPEGWYIALKPSYQESEITAVKLEPGKKETLKISAYTPVNKDQQKPGDYEIKLIASNEDLNLSEETILSATITTVYDLSLTAKYGVLNTKATAGKNNPFILVLKNTGSDDMENIAFTSDAPQKWIVKFDPEKIEKLAPDESKDIEITITPPDQTIAGDYLLNFSAKNDDVTKDVDVRVTVETPSIWGWVGIGVIVIVVIGVAIVFARLGRR